MIQETSALLALAASGIFFLTGLLTGSWKYRCMRSSEKGVAPYYVDIAHRAALTYSFAALLLAVFASLSALPAWLDTVAVAAPLLFFAISIAQYIRLGYANTTDNQIRDSRDPAREKIVFTLLEIAEIGGFSILLIGFALRLL